MRYEFESGENRIAFDVVPSGDGWRIALPDGTAQDFAATRLPENRLSITTGGTSFRVSVAKTARGMEIAYQGQTWIFKPATARKAGTKSGKSSGVLTAPMVGVVADVLVTEGESVAAYQSLVVVEAMKVIASLDAPFAGTVSKVPVTKGQRVAHGEVLVEIVPNAESEI